MPGTRYTKQIYEGEVVETRPIGRPKKSWLEGVLNRHRIKTSINKRAVQAKVMKLRDAQVECQVRSRWRKVCSDLQQETIVALLAPQKGKAVKLCMYVCMYKIHQLMDFSPGMSYYQNQIQHKKLE